MDARTPELAVPAGPALGRLTAGRGSLKRPRLLRGAWVYLWLLLVSLLIAALSLTFPSTPSYDPWSWLLWGRQIAHGTLSLKANGSSWKPMPVVFTTVLSLFGSAAPNLWLLVARAGFVATVLMSFKLSWRIVAGLPGPWPTGVDAEAERSGRALGSLAAVAVRYAPAALAGAIAAVGIGLTHGFPGNSLLGYSEGVAAAATLIGFERALDGHHRQAFALGLVAALDRPESWAIWGPYGLWLMWKDPGARKLVVSLAILALVLWLIPQKLGGKSAVGTALTSRMKSSAANSSFPLWTELKTVEWVLVLTRVKLIGIAGLIVSCVLVWRRRRRTGTLRATASGDASLLLLVVLGLFGFAWWLGIAIETQLGFAGNPRYAVFGAIPVYIIGAATYAWLALALARWFGRWRLSRRRPDRATAPATDGAGAQRSSAPSRRPSWRLSLSATTALLAVVFMFGPGWVGASLMTINSLRYSERYQGRIREEVSALVKARTAQAILDCGTIVTENHQVPMLAWYLGVETHVVGAASLASPSQPANVIFQVAAAPGGGLAPSDDMIGQWEALGRNYRITLTDPVNFYEDCRK